MGKFSLLVLLTFLVWGFWMSYEWLRNPNKRKRKDK